MATLPPSAAERSISATWMPACGQVGGGAQPGDAGADDRHARRRVDADGLERPQAPALATAAATSDVGLGRRLGLVVGRPADLFADVDVLVEVRVEPAPLEHTAERGLVQLGEQAATTTRSSCSLFDVLGDQALARVRAHEHVGARNGHALKRARSRDHLLDVDDVGDIAAAVADVHTDAWGVASPAIRHSPPR